MPQNKSVEEVVEEFKKIIIRYGAEEKEILETTDFIRGILQTSQEREREIVEAMCYKAFNEGVSSGMDEYRKHKGGKIWQETNTFQTIAQKYNLTLTNPNKD